MILVFQDHSPLLISASSSISRRFDLVLVLLDSPEKEWDKRVSTFLLQQAVNAGVETIRNNAGQSSGGMKSSLTKEKGGTGKGTGKGATGGDEKWEMFRLRDYIAYVKHAFQPVMSKEAQLVLMRYYQMQRQSEERSQGRTTVRLLESLMRLSEAHAKVMARYAVVHSTFLFADTMCVQLNFSFYSLYLQLCFSAQLFPPCHSSSLSHLRVPLLFSSLSLPLRKTLCVFEILDN